MAEREPRPSDDPNPVREMRLVVTADDYEEAVRFYRDVLGLPERASYSSPDGRVVILEAGRATLEIADPNQAEFIDRVEVGRRVAGHIRVAFEVDDSGARPRVLAAGGADRHRPGDADAVGDDERPARRPGRAALTLFSDAPPARPYGWPATADEHGRDRDDRERPDDRRPRRR